MQSGTLLGFQSHSIFNATVPSDWFRSAEASFCILKTTITINNLGFLKIELGPKDEKTQD